MKLKLTSVACGISLALAAGQILAAEQASANDSMAFGLNGYTVSAPLFTVGETFYYTDGDLNATTAGNYTPPGILDGLGAYELDEHTVRVFANHELTFPDGYPYEVSDGMGGTFQMTGTRVSYFDIDKFSKDIVDAGIAYDTIYDANGNIASDTSFLPADQESGGMTRFCSAMLVEPLEFAPNNGKGRGKGRANSSFPRGIVDRIFFTGEETDDIVAVVSGSEFGADPALAPERQGGYVVAVDTATGEYLGRVTLTFDPPSGQITGGGIHAGHLPLRPGFLCIPSQ